ncbi:MAG: type II toxin-antitoxin system HicA family toxin [Methanosarcinales archaeon]
MKLPRTLSSKKVTKAFEKLGFEFRRQTGSHLIYRKHDIVISIPKHDQVKVGTLRQLIRVAGITKKDFIEALDK